MNKELAIDTEMGNILMRPIEDESSGTERTRKDISVTHPSLLYNSFKNKNMGSEYAVSENDYNGNYGNFWYSEQDVQEHTVDRTIVQRDYVSKQVLLDVLSKLNEKLYDDPTGSYQETDFIMSELGLDE